MSILSGWIKEHYYKKTANGYMKASRDTSSDTVFMPDGKTATTNLGSIKGITSDLSGESENIAASIKCVNQLNCSLTASDNLKFRFVTDGEGNYGYLGADDSFVPFKKASSAPRLIVNRATSNPTLNGLDPQKTYIIYFAGGARNGCYATVNGNRIGESSDPFGYVLTGINIITGITSLELSTNAYTDFHWYVFEC